LGNLEPVNTKIWAIVAAAGVGARFSSGLPKQYCELAGTPIIVRTLRRLAEVARVAGIGVGIAPGDSAWAGLTAALPPSVWSFTGGATRSETVQNGLAELMKRGEGDAWVLVHDAARPCVQAEDINRLIDAVNYEAPGGLLATLISDTVKSVDDTLRVAKTVPRANLWRAQTPQLFPVDLLHRALTQCCERQRECTDDAQAIEHLGMQPSIVPCAGHNLKITRRSDLALATAILQEQESNACSG
jgi:2-C-methyl-D-erythritol 4-phosphate cytidylyltransferase|tara:strand:+ start:1691 stop:2422 length:732 start_codon:yes stop_codon:yes gene_type:complete